MPNYVSDNFKYVTFTDKGLSHASERSTASFSASTTYPRWPNAYSASGVPWKGWTIGPVGGTPFSAIPSSQGGPILPGLLPSPFPGDPVWSKFLYGLGGETELSNRISPTDSIGLSTGQTGGIGPSDKAYGSLEAFFPSEQVESSEDPPYFSCGYDVQFRKSGGSLIGDYLFIPSPRTAPFDNGGEGGEGSTYSGGEGGEGGEVPIEIVDEGYTRKSSCYFNQNVSCWYADELFINRLIPKSYINKDSGVLVFTFYARRYNKRRRNGDEYGYEYGYEYGGELYDIDYQPQP